MSPRPAALPDELTRSALETHCRPYAVNSNKLRDEETGAPYAYTVSDGVRFELCADFYDPARARAMRHVGTAEGFDPQTGCYRGELYLQAQSGS